MRSFPTTGIYLDKSYTNRKGKHAIKIRVTYRRKTKYFKTGIHLSEQDFEQSYLSDRPRGQNKVLKIKLHDLEARAFEILQDLSPFTFDGWEKQFYTTDYDKDLVKYHYEEKTKELLSEEKYSSKDAYNLSFKHLAKFFKKESFSFIQITPQKLREFERYMIKEGYSITTVGIHLRCLRHIFKRAIESKDIPQEIYPFGSSRGKYKIPASRNIKKALDIDVVKKLIEIDLSAFPWQEKARDFWLLSFYCNGMNFNDLLRLKKENLVDRTLTFTRKKTSRTRKEVTPTQLILIPQALDILEKYHNELGDFLINTLEGARSEEEARKRIRNFTRFVNQHMKNVCLKIEYDGPISSIYARHSWASLALNKGVPIEYISSGLSHESINTTRAYLKGFTTDSIMENTNLIFKDL